MATRRQFLPAILILLAGLAFVGVGVFFSLSHPMCIFPDQGLYLHMAKLFLAGKVPYVDMFDNNPPLAIYLQIFPILLAGRLHLPEPLAFSLYIWSLVILAATIGGALLLRCGNRSAMYTGLVALLGFAYFNQVEIIDFGQREHIFVVLYLAFFLLRYLRWQQVEPDKNIAINKFLAILAGILAGTGIGLKHYFLLIALAPELVWALEKRTIRPLLAPETLAAAATILLYLLHFCFLPRAELDIFFNFMLPIYREGYKYYVTSLSYNLNTIWRNDFYLMLLLTAGAFGLSKRNGLVLPLQAFAVMSTMVFVFAGQVWSYHVLPIRLANVMAIALQTFLLLDFLPAPLKNFKQAPLFAATSLLVAATCVANDRLMRIVNDPVPRDEFFMTATGFTGLCPETDIDSFSQIVLDHSTIYDSILFISSSMSPGYPVFLQTGRKPASRFLHAMVLPILQYVIEKRDLKDRDFFKAKMQQIFAWYAEDIEKNKPKLIFIQKPYITDMLASHDYLKKELAGYRLLQEHKDNVVMIRRD